MFQRSVHPNNLPSRQHTDCLYLPVEKPTVHPNFKLWFITREDAYHSIPGTSETVWLGFFWRPSAVFIDLFWRVDSDGANVCATPRLEPTVQLEGGAKQFPSAVGLTCQVSVHERHHQWRHVSSTSLCHLPLCVAAETKSLRPRTGVQLVGQLHRTLYQRYVKNWRDSLLKRTQEDFLALVSAFTDTARPCEDRNTALCYMAGETFRSLVVPWFQTKTIVCQTRCDSEYCVWRPRTQHFRLGGNGEHGEGLPPKRVPSLVLSRQHSGRNRQQFW